MLLKKEGVLVQEVHLNHERTHYFTHMKQQLSSLRAHNVFCGEKGNPSAFAAEMKPCGSVRSWTGSDTAAATKVDFDCTDQKDAPCLDIPLDFKGLRANPIWII